MATIRLDRSALLRGGFQTILHRGSGALIRKGVIIGRNAHFIDALLSFFLLSFVDFKY